MKIKIGIPKDDPEITIELDTKRLLELFKEAASKLPFKVEFKGEKEKK